MCSDAVLALLTRLEQICNHRGQAQHALTERTLEETIAELHAGNGDLADRRWR